MSEFNQHVCDYKSNRRAVRIIRDRIRWSECSEELVRHLNRPTTECEDYVDFYSGYVDHFIAINTNKEIIS